MGMTDLAIHQQQPFVGSYSGDATELATPGFERKAGL